MNLKIFMIMVMIGLVHSLPNKGYHNIEVNIDEELLPGTWITTLSSNPALSDSKNFEFTFIHDSDGNHVTQNYINVDKFTGNVTIKSKIDRDTEGFCHPSNEICNRSSLISVIPEYDEIILLNIIINDINDNAPIFSKPSILFEIKELTPINTRFKLPPAVDKDTKLFGLNNFTISPKPGSESSSYIAKKFAVFKHYNGDYPELMLRESLNLDENKLLNSGEIYSFNVVANDFGKPPKQGILEVKIIIIDENKHEPVFNQQVYEESVREDAKVNTPILTVFAEDSDKGSHGKISFSFSEPSEMFSIDSETGQISLKSSLDREKVSSYSLVVLAMDGGLPPKSSTSTVKITVEDVNDNEPNIILSSMLNNFSVWENTIPLFAVAMVRVTDVDDHGNAYVTCEIKQGKESFGISQHPNIRENLKVISFQSRIIFYLRSTVEFDSEEARVVNVTLVCRDNPRDGRSMTSSVDFQVKILDHNDNHPIFDKDVYNFSILENQASGSSVGKVSAMDLDEGKNAEITYKSSDDRFDIDPLTGDITSRIVFDREAVSSYEFEVVATDGGSPSMSGNTTVRVEIVDVNDNAPSFDRSEYVFSVMDSSLSDAKIGTIVATDADEGDNAVVVFSVVNDPEECSEISIDSKSGELSATRDIVAKRCKIHNFKVKVANPKSDKVSSVPVIVFVKEPKDKEPVFAFPKINNNSVVVRYPVAKGDEIARLSVIPEDTIWTYVLLETILIPGEDSSVSMPKLECLDKLFILDSKTGSLAIDPPCLANLYVGHNLTFELKVRASDAKMSFLRSDSTLKISFEDFPINNNDFNLASLTSNPNFIIIIVIVASTSLLVIVLVTIIFCLVTKSRRHRGKSSEVKYKMCCRISPPISTTITMGNVANELLQDNNKMQHNSSSASTLCDRDSQSSDSGRGPSENDFQPIHSIISKRANGLPISTSGVSDHPNGLRSSQGYANDSLPPYPGQQQLNSTHNGKPPIYNPGRSYHPHQQQLNGRYLDGSSNNLYDDDSPDSFNHGGRTRSQGPQQSSRTSSIQSLRPQIMAPTEDFNQLESNGVRNSKRILGRRDLKRSSMVISPKNHQVAKEDSGRTRNSSQEGLDNPSHAPFYFPGRAGMKNSLPRVNSLVPSHSTVRPPKHVTFDDGVPTSADLGVRREFVPSSNTLTNSSASSGYYNVRKADPDHKSPVSFMLV